MLSFVFLCLGTVSCTLDEDVQSSTADTEELSKAPEKEPDIKDFITFSEVKIPYGLFECEMSECMYADIEYVRSYTGLIGLRPDFDFEHGCIINWQKNGEMFTHSTSLERVRKIDGVIYDVSEYVSLGEDALSQYEQVEDGKGFALNQTYFLSLPLHASRFDKEGHYTAEGRPDSFPLLTYPKEKIKTVKYERGICGEYTAIRVSGEYDDSENRVETKNVACSITYLMWESEIVAYLYTQTEYNDAKTEYIESISYCVPFTGELDLLSDEEINELLKLAGES